MDGFKDHDNVIVIGATNFEKALDAAIMQQVDLKRLFMYHCQM